MVKRNLFFVFSLAFALVFLFSLNLASASYDWPSYGGNWVNNPQAQYNSYYGGFQYFYNYSNNSYDAIPYNDTLITNSFGYDNFKQALTGYNTQKQLLFTNLYNDQGFNSPILIYPNGAEIYVYNLSNQLLLANINTLLPGDVNGTVSGQYALGDFTGNHEYSSFMGMFLSNYSMLQFRVYNYNYTSNILTLNSSTNISYGDGVYSTGVKCTNAGSIWSEGQAFCDAYIENSTKSSLYRFFENGTYVDVFDINQGYLTNVPDRANAPQFSNDLTPNDLWYLLVYNNPLTENGQIIEIKYNGQVVANISYTDTAITGAEFYHPDAVNTYRIVVQTSYGEGNEQGCGINAYNLDFSNYANQVNLTTSLSSSCDGIAIANYGNGVNGDSYDDIFTTFKKSYNSGSYVPFFYVLKGSDLSTLVSLNLPGNTYTNIGQDSSSILSQPSNTFYYGSMTIARLTNDTHPDILYFPGAQENTYLIDPFTQEVYGHPQGYCIPGDVANNGYMNLLCTTTSKIYTRVINYNAPGQGIISGSSNNTINITQAQINANSTALLKGVVNPLTNFFPDASSLSFGQKAGIVVIIMFFSALILFFGAGAINGEGMHHLVPYIVLIVELMEFIYFTAISYIPVYIVVTLSLISAGLIAIRIKGGSH